MPAAVEVSPNNSTGFSDSTRPADEASFLASDGQEIFYRVWKPTASSSQGVMLFHRGHEHSGRWQEFVDTSGLDDCWFFAWDARGHGRTEGKRGAAESFSRMVRDAEEFAQHIDRTYHIKVDDIVVVGQSVGAVLAAAWVHDYAPPIRAMVLATPALRIKLYVPFAISGLRMLQKVRPESFIRSYVRPSMLTRDSQQARFYADDPLVSPQIAVNILLDLYDTSTRLIDDAAAIHTPTLMMVSGHDYVVRKDVQQKFFERLSSPDKQLDVLDGGYHSTFWDQGREQVIAKTADFLRQRFGRPMKAPSSDTLAGGSQAKYQALQRPPSLFRRAWFGCQRLALHTAGRPSRGIRIGWQSGFDSGQSLDYVYRNRAEGTTLVGKMIDRGYLDSIGWRGIRQRKVHMERLLDEAIANAVQRFGEVTIMDIAAGPGRYVLETIKRNESLPIRAILCDRDPGGIAQGRQLAEQFGLSDRVEFRQSDAFDPGAIRAAAGTKVHIAIVSGLYELFPANELLKKSLQGIASVMVDGGWLLYTDQPWHPQQEMIARVLPNRDGDRWIMRCRSQAEMDALVREAGLQREKMYLDQWGIFSVALATNQVAG